MTDHTHEFFEFCIRNDVLAFGEFTLKSGRVSPYFFNAAHFDNGLLLGHLATYYASLIHEVFADRKPYMLYGPAYKGIPLVSACAIRLADRYDLKVPYAFNRKEAKDHAEGGHLVGARLDGDVIILDDVITAGTSVHESVQTIRSAGAVPTAVVIALDREEIAGDSGLSAVQAVETTHGIPVYPIARLSDLIDYLQSRSTMASLAQSIIEYRVCYGSSQQAMPEPP